MMVSKHRRVNKNQTEIEMVRMNLIKTLGFSVGNNISITGETTALAWSRFLLDELCAAFVRK